MSAGEASSKERRPINAGFLALIVLLVGGAFAYFLLVGKPAPEPEPLPIETSPTVDVVVANPQAMALPVKSQGTVRPLRQVNLLSQVSGRVETVSEFFAPGAFFAAGEPLVQLEDEDYRLAIVRTKSQLAAAQQRLAEEEGRASQAKREWRDLGTVKANDLFLRKPQLTAAAAAVEAAKADLRSAELNLARTAIAVPFNGRVVDKQVDIGQYVAPGTPIATVYATDVAQIRLPLTDRQVALLDLPFHSSEGSVKSLVEVRLQARFAGREWEWQGQIVRTDASIDERSRVVYAVAEVQQPFAREAGSQRPPLAPGLFVNATITGKTVADVVQLPRPALRSNGQVMVVESDDRTGVREVRILDGDGTSVWVQGLQSGDRVVVHEPVPLAIGMTVKVNELAALAGAEL